MSMLYNPGNQTLVKSSLLKGKEKPDEDISFFFASENLEVSVI